jgi:trimeric autotransporter adhesin
MQAAGTITRVAGIGTAGSAGDDGPATDAQLSTPADVAVTTDGGFLISDYSNNVVRKVSGVGTITRVAGTGTAGNSGDDGPATDAELSNPWGLAVTDDGGFLIADFANHLVRKVSAAGMITRVAGNGTAGNSGDDGPATDAELSGPTGLAVTADGGFLVADSNNNVVREVSASGTITRVAGTGTAGFSGDDGPATDAQLSTPVGLAVIPGGGFLIGDAGNSVVREVSGSGTITRVAGTGTAGSSGDDGAATEAELFMPAGLTLTTVGGFLIADYSNNLVRAVSASGTITRFAGTGTAGRSGDDGPATEAQLSGPVGVAIAADGGVLIADSANNEVREVAGSPPG